MATISPQTALVLLSVLDAQAFSLRILRLQLAANRALLTRLVNTYPSVLSADDCGAIADALAAGADALAFTEAA